MFGLNNLKVYWKLRILMAMATVGLGIFAWVAFSTLQTVEVNGPLYQRIDNAQNVASDIVPGLLLAVTALLTSVPVACWSRCRESDFPGREGRVAAPSRPTESNSPDPVQTGVAQIELGWQHAWLTSTVSADAFVNLVKLGVWCNAELRWSGSSFLRYSAGTSAVSGVGDNFVTGQYRFLRESKRMPSTALAYAIKSPTASAVKGLGSGEIDQAVTLELGKSVHGFSSLWNATYFSIGQTSGGAQTKGEWTWALSRSVTRRWAVTAEIFGDTKLNAGNDAYVNTTWALNYLPQAWLVFDVGTNVPLTSGPGAPGNTVFGGVTYAVADLYRRHRR